MCCALLSPGRIFCVFFTNARAVLEKKGTLRLFPEEADSKVTVNRET